ncbi:MAG: single-stranded-DNA-specific exonuclease RecJ, partial [Alphaproteobacteria bacterium]|nr:single-stranded-DNA-specific exonuclease RecJ [Alphaproteobacteria bacterium]
MALVDLRDDGAVLGVERSLTGRRWRPRGGDARTALMLAQRLGVPEAVARVLAARGIDADAAPAFLDPRLRDALPDPGRLAGMDKAAARLAAAVANGEPIALFGDYDVDGATGTALLARTFAALGVPVRVYIPDRMTEGYGPTAPALLRLAAEGIRVVVTIDCGIVAFEALAAAADAGLAVVVV